MEFMENSKLKMFHNHLIMLSSMDVIRFGTVLAFGPKMSYTRPAGPPWRW